MDSVRVDLGSFASELRLVHARLCELYTAGRMIEPDELRFSHDRVLEWMTIADASEAIFEIIRATEAPEEGGMGSGD